MASTFENQLLLTLTQSFRAYIRHGAEHLFESTPTSEDLLQSILNMQGAMEVLAKLYQLKTNGWKSILEEKHHGESEPQLLHKLNTGGLRTTRYEMSKKHLIKQRAFEEVETELLAKLQVYRNAVAHLGLPTLSAEVGNEIKQLMVRVLNALAWEALAGRWTEVFLANRSAIVFGPVLFEKIIADKCYVDEAIALANESDWKVRNCPDCWKPTFGEVDDGESSVLCYCCGYGFTDIMAKFATCPACLSEDSLFYDALNAANLNPVRAMCLDCREKFDVVVCQECGQVALNVPAWVCKDCGPPSPKEKKSA